MAKSKVNCAHCKQDFMKENKFINQMIKLGQVNHFCNIKCLRAFAAEKSKPNSKCAQCGSVFYKIPKEKLRSKVGNDFCSSKCSATYNNKTRSRSFYKNEIHRICPLCGNPFISKVGAVKSTKCRECRPLNKYTVRVDKVAKVKLKREWTPRVRLFQCKKCDRHFEKFDKTGKSRKILCHECWFTIQSERGRESGKKQNTNRRSKNEIHFAELCKSKFKVVLENPKMFNGWDADVVIEDLKIAVLRNGPWHYRKIKTNHSLGMVQNRDKIKIKEIEKAGYTPYIIRDDGNEDKKLVISEFEKFISSLESSDG